ncbi:MAG: hypothetical protein Ct9H300mP20_22630 [Gammaproteobacteria bacterium]|nr:MAG: hypothetical protein Ct9H300mP20_22630 [Gammaproteobacteria bacterium]
MVRTSGYGFYRRWPLRSSANDDYDVWHPHIIEGGLLAIHDVFPNPEDGGRPPFKFTQSQREWFVKEVA